MLVTSIFSSPELEVLRVSYCDPSCVHRPSCFINFLPCVRSRGHIFSPTIMKLGQNVCLDEISHEFKKWVTLGTLVYTLEAAFYD